MEMDTMQDRRADARWRTRRDAVGDILNLGLARVGRGFEARTEDVSQSGLRLRTPVRLEPGDRLRLAFPSERLEDPAVSVEGEVVWIRPPKLLSLGKWMAGIEFRPPDQPGIPTLIERAREVDTLPPID